MSRAVFLALGGALVAGTALAQDMPEGNAEAGRALAGQCRTCHGLDGYAQIPIAPHIGGEPAAYLAEQLLAFREGRREHEMMSVVAAGLSDEQIADLAAWYASHTVSVEMTSDPSEAPELCSGCHGVDGIARVEGVPNLAGEANIYIETQLKAFRSGQRDDPSMTAIAANLSDAEMREAADWYGSVRLTISAPGE